MSTNESKFWLVVVMTGILCRFHVRGVSYAVSECACLLPRRVYGCACVSARECVRVYPCARARVPMFVQVLCMYRCCACEALCVV